MTLEKSKFDTAVDWFDVVFTVAVQLTLTVLVILAITHQAWTEGIFWLLLFGMSRQTARYKRDRK
jgi:predicted cobalt transporter CbtA